MTSLVIYCFIYGWTQWPEQSGGRSASSTGLLLVPSFVIAAAASASDSRGRRLLGPLLIGTTALTAGSVCPLFRHATSPLWALAGVSLLFGLPTGLNTVDNQAAMYAQAPGEQIGAAAGLLRSFMYFGAVLSASLISIAYQHRATDAGLHRLALVMGVASALLLPATLASRSLRSDQLSPRAHHHIHMHGLHGAHLLELAGHVSAALQKPRDGEFGLRRRRLWNDSSSDASEDADTCAPVVANRTRSSESCPSTHARARPGVLRPLRGSPKPGPARRCAEVRVCICRAPRAGWVSWLPVSRCVAGVPVRAAGPRPSSRFRRCLTERGSTETGG